ncbi:MAG: hypothetical protein IJK18_04360 [Clostridia bacterium]|nr:hypothetical protein [Clostridia bacterium]
MCLKNKVEVNDELIIQKSIDNFNNDFKTKIKKDNISFLVSMYYNFVNLLSTDQVTSRDDLKKLVDVEERLNKSFNKEQQELFTEWNDLQDKMFDEYEKRAFIFGYCTCSELNIESKMSRN